MLTILIGLLVLGIVVFVHELGHFIAALVCGVEVESFSIGWGPVLLKKKYGTTEYRLSAIPLGGYCGMKGEHAFKDALEQKLSAIPYEEKSMFSVHPLKRVIIACAGPFANLLLAAAAFSAVSAIGTTYYTTDNRIIPVYLFDSSDQSPARQAELQLADRILMIDGVKMETFADIQEYIAVHPDEELTFLIERNGGQFSKTIKTKLNKKTGTGQLGIYQYIPLEVQRVVKNAAADSAGIKTGDRITAINGEPVDNHRAMQYFFQNYREKDVSITIMRDNTALDIPIKLVRTENGAVDLGIIWKVMKVTQPGTSFPASIKAGLAKTYKTLGLTVKSIGLLFKGVNLSDAVAGPVRISVMIGAIAQESFQESVAAGFTNICEIAALICISLFLMNMLPVPILDGGLILFALIEWIVRKQINPRILYYVQFIGAAFIAVLFVFALWSDILFFMGSPR